MSGSGQYLYCCINDGSNTGTTLRLNLGIPAITGPTGSVGSTGIVVGRTGIGVGRTGSIGLTGINTNSNVLTGSQNNSTITLVTLQTTPIAYYYINNTNSTPITITSIAGLGNLQIGYQAIINISTSGSTSTTTISPSSITSSTIKLNVNSNIILQTGTGNTPYAKLIIYNDGTRYYVKCVSYYN
jgi:hypothetical protein